MTNSQLPCSADITELEIWRMISQDVKERIAEGDGFWRSCSGCCETSDGYNVNGYPHSSVFGCELGSGCSECGGIGAVWDNLDYSQVGEDGVTGDVAQSSQVTDALIEALNPFAMVAELDVGQDETDADIFQPMRSGYNRAPLITVGDMRRAAAALAAQPPAGSEGEPFMMLSCREAKQCLHNIPGCICDGDPTNG